jgi:hypothetical protein
MHANVAECNKMQPEYCCLVAYTHYVHTARVKRLGPNTSKRSHSQQAPQYREIEKVLAISVC